MILDSETLTDGQFDLAASSRRFPTILSCGGRKRTARSLAKRGWGDVENGASGEKIFRLNQDGCDALEWLDGLEV